MVDSDKKGELDAKADELVAAIRAHRTLHTWADIAIGFISGVIFAGIAFNLLSGI